MSDCKGAETFRLGRKLRQIDHMNSPFGALRFGVPRYVHVELGITSDPPYCRCLDAMRDHILEKSRAIS
jgi:hypothetical protein